MFATHAVVTGASNDVSLSPAKELTSCKYDPIVFSSSEVVPQGKDSICSANTKVTDALADLPTREGVEHLWDKVADLVHPVNVACINVGIDVGGQFGETDFDEELKINQTKTIATDHILFVLRYGLA